MVNVFGERGSEQQIDLKVITRVEEEAGKYKDWLPEITASYRLGFPPYRISSTGVSPIRICDRNVNALTDTVALDIGDRVIHDDGKLAYFHLADEGSVWALQGNRGSAGVQGVQGIPGPTGHPGSAGKRGNRGSEGPVGKIGKVGLKGLIGPVVAGVKGVAGDDGPRGPLGHAGSKGQRGEQGVKRIKGLEGSVGPVGHQGIRGDTGLVGIRGDRGPAGKSGPQGGAGGLGHQGPQGSEGPEGDQGLPGIEGPKGNLGPEGPAGKQGPMGERADAGNVIDVMGIYVPILVAKRYLAKMGFVKYLINKSGSSYRIVNLGIQTLVNMSNYHGPTWHFDAAFVPGSHTKRGKPAQYYIDLEMSSYKCPYDLAFNKVTAIYFV